MSRPLFVYGTFMAGAPQGALLAGLRRTPAQTRGVLWLLPAGYPALELRPHGGVVHGELVDAPPDRVLGLLDRFEGVGEGLYERVSVDVEIGLSRVAAWAWVMSDLRLRGARPIPSGRWRPTRSSPGA